MVVHDMARELPRTLRSLSPRCQVGIEADDYEVIVVDNGSAVPVDPALGAAFGGSLRVERIDPAPPSPVRAANHGLEVGDRGRIVGLLIDGARLVSPGLLAGVCRARRLAERPVITSGFPPRLGHPHAHAEVGYDQDGGRRVAGRLRLGARRVPALRRRPPAGSSGSLDLFGPVGETSSLFTLRGVWDELGGLDELFALPAEGLANHDLYARACSLSGSS